jgi:hypothetical protein
MNIYNIYIYLCIHLHIYIGPLPTELIENIEENHTYDIANRKTSIGDINLNNVSFSSSGLSSSPSSSSTLDFILPRLLTAKELAEVIGDNVETDCYTSLMKNKIDGLRILKGKFNDQAVIVKIIIPTSLQDTTNAHSLEFLRELQVLCELSHPNILPLYGYTFNPLVRIFKLTPSPNKPDSHGSFPPIQKDNRKENLISLYFLLFEKKERFTWKKRIRVAICLLQALIYLWGDIDSGRRAITHRYTYI